MKSLFGVVNEMGLSWSDSQALKKGLLGLSCSIQEKGRYDGDKAICDIVVELEKLFPSWSIENYREIKGLVFKYYLQGVGREFDGVAFP